MFIFHTLLPIVITTSICCRYITVLCWHRRGMGTC